MFIHKSSPYPSITNQTWTILHLKTNMFSWTEIKNNTKSIILTTRISPYKLLHLWSSLPHYNIFQPSFHLSSSLCDTLKSNSVSMAYYKSFFQILLKLNLENSSEKTTLNMCKTFPFYKYQSTIINLKNFQTAHILVSLHNNFACIYLYTTLQLSKWYPCRRTSCFKVLITILDFMRVSAISTNLA